MRYFINLSYLGANFHGWQNQPNDISVQSVIERALSTLMRRPVAIVGAGRTDAGVNAMTMVAHVDLDDDIDTTALIRSLNSMCRPDITIQSIDRVHDDAHARFDATQRTYRYFVHTRPDPFIKDQSWLAPPTLDFEAMNRAAALLIGRRDYTSFSKLHTDVKTNFCDIRSAKWVRFSPHQYYFEISADRFLRNMVRAIVGTLVDIGRHKNTPESILETIDKKDRCSAGTSMPGHALFLWDIEYPYYHKPPIRYDNYKEEK